MASLLRVLAAKPYVSVLRRSFAALAAKTTIQQGPDATTTPSINEAPLFETLRGVIHDNSLAAIKHTHMSPVQARIFPLLPGLVLPYNPATPRSTDDPKDLLVKAKTGTGKTMGFLIPAIEARLKAIDAHLESVVDDAAITVTPQLRAKAIHNYAVERVGTLIVSPTRELATQIANEAANLTKKHRGFGIRILLGGESKNRQIREWEGRKDIVVCTPGRLLDLLDTEPPFSKALKYTQMLVLDEADTLLEMGFRDDIESIKSHLPKSPERQTLLFSATVSPAIRQVAISTMSSSYKYINCVSEDDSPVHNHIPQYHTVVDPSQLLSYLLQLITHDQLITGGKSKIIVFFSTTKAVQLFSDLIVRAAPESLPSGRRTKVYEMHSKRDMARRMNISKCFRNDASGSCILVTSDVSARGVDYPGVSRVIQMGVPGSGDMYVHRVGRTGRGDNKTGRGDLVTCSWEMGFIKRQLRSMPLQTLTVSDMLEQIKELADSKDAEVAGSEYASRLDKIEPTCRTTLEGVGEEEASDTFISQVGFYFGRISEMGLNKDDVLSGLQTWAKELFRLERPPSISHSMQMRLGLLSTSSPSRSSYSSTSSYSSRSSYSSPSRSSGSSAPWMGRGNRPMASRQSGAGSGYNASSWGVGSGGYGSTSRDSKGSYAPRDSQFGSRDYKDNYTPRASQYGSRDSKSYTPGASKYGSRDSKSSKYGSRNSKDNYSSGGSKYGSRASAGRKSSDEYNWQD